MFDTELHDLQEELCPLHDLELFNISTSPLNISTMTIGFRSTMPLFNLMLFKENLMKKEGELRLREVGLRLRQHKEGSTRFSNCVVFESDSSRIVTKLFRNGSLHSTGSKNTKDAIDMSESIFKLFEENIYVTETNIQMINCNFKIGFPLDLLKCKEKLLERNIVVVFNRENHPGVNIKFSNNKTSKIVTILLFVSGSIIITGSKTIEDIFECYKFITSFLDDEKHYIHYSGTFIPKNKGGEKKKPGRKRKNEAQDFYSALNL